MSKKIAPLLFIIFLFILISCSNDVKRIPFPEEIISKIDRGLVFFSVDELNYLSWRKLPNDASEYTIWRKALSSENSKIEQVGKTKKTFYHDTKISIKKDYAYYVSTDAEPDHNLFQAKYPNSVIYNDHNALSFNLGGDYKQAQIVTGDLTGDGELEIIVAHTNMIAVDPTEKAWMKSTDKFTVSTFTFDGKPLWNFDLGWGIEAGPFYAPIVAWDIDADGKSEVILKTNKSDDPKNYDTEFLTILNGETGKIKSETRWPTPVSDDYNSNSRNYIAVAHLDGKNVSIIVGRGTYKAQIIVSYDNELVKEWDRIIGTDIKPKFENRYLMKIWRKISNDKSRSSHSLPIADVDENGTEEILWGEHAITADGIDLWEVEDKAPYLGHPDIVYAADIIPELPGKEIYYCREGWMEERENIGMLLVDKYGETIWSNWGYTHVDGGWAARVIPGSDEWQMFAYDVKKKDWKPGVRTFINPSQIFMNSKGEVISNPDSSWIRSFTVDWEGDGIKELCTEAGVLKRYNDEVLADFGEGVYWGGDLFGDHREELVVAPRDGKLYIVFNTSELKSEPKITRLADRQYKNDLSRTAMQFNVIPTESGYIPKLNN